MRPGARADPVGPPPPWAAAGRRVVAVVAVVVALTVAGVGAGVPAGAVDVGVADGVVAGVPAGGVGTGVPAAGAAVGSGWGLIGRGPAVGTEGAYSVSSWAPGRVDLFVRGGDNALWHRWSGDGGATIGRWETLGAPPGGLASAPASVSWGYDRIDVFVEGADHGLWHTWWDGAAWGGWEPLGGVLTASPAVSSWGPGRLDVFVAGSDHAGWHRWYQAGSWSGWSSLGGALVSAPAATAWGPDRIDLFGAGVDRRLYHQWWDGTRWSGWVTETAGVWTSPPTVASWGPGRLDVFGVGTDQAVWHLWYDQGWSAPESLGGAAASAPAAVSWGGHRWTLFVAGTDAGLYRQTSMPPAGTAVALTGIDASRMDGFTWHPGCPVGLDQLRELTVDYWGMDGAAHEGQVVVNADVVAPVAGAFASMFEAHFPIQQVGDAAEYGGDDNQVMTNDTSTAFNCRSTPGSTGPPSASMHSWGRAVDVNPLINPYVNGGLVEPPAGLPYVDRAQTVPGMIHHGDAAWLAWSAVSWRWGGDWSGLKDYQHFSFNGQ